MITNDTVVLADNAILVDYEGKYLTEGPGFNMYLG
jgi:hypothetical protein